MNTNLCIAGVKRKDHDRLAFSSLELELPGNVGVETSIPTAAASSNEEHCLFTIALRFTRREKLTICIVDLSSLLSEIKDEAVACATN